MESPSDSTKFLSLITIILIIIFTIITCDNYVISVMLRGYFLTTVFYYDDYPQRFSDAKNAMASVAPYHMAHY